MTDANTLADIFLAMGARVSQAEEEIQGHKYSLQNEEESHKRTKEQLQKSIANNAILHERMQSLEKTASDHKTSIEKLKLANETLKKRLKIKKK